MDLSARKDIWFGMLVLFNSLHNAHISSPHSSCCPSNLWPTSSNVGRSLAESDRNLTRDEGHYETQFCLDSTFLFSLWPHRHSSARTRDKARKGNVSRRARQ